MLSKMSDGIKMHVVTYVAVICDFFMHKRRAIINRKYKNL